MCCGSIGKPIITEVPRIMKRLLPGLQIRIFRNDICSPLIFSTLSIEVEEGRVEINCCQPCWGWGKRGMQEVTDD